MDTRPGRFFGGVNRVIDASIRGYARVLSRALQWKMVMLALFVVGLSGTWQIFQMVPSAFVPQEDEGYFMTIVQAPSGASLEYTTDIAQQAEKILFADKEIQAVFSVLGFSFSGAAPNNGMMFARLRDWSERPGKEQSLDAVLSRIAGSCSAFPVPVVAAFAPPGIQGLSVFGGFQFELLDQSGGDINGLAAATQALVGAGNQSGRVRGLFSPFRADDPQLVVNIDRDRARSLGLPLREVTDALQVFLGSQYVNDFDFKNRAYRVYVQADQRFRADPGDLGQLYARAQSGDMVPLDTVVQLKETTAPQVISHFNMFRSAEINGIGRAGRELGSGDGVDGAAGPADAAGRIRLRVGRAVARRDQGRLAGRLHLRAQHPDRVSGARRAIRELGPAAHHPARRAAGGVRGVERAAPARLRQRRVLPGRAGHARRPCGKELDSDRRVRRAAARARHVDHRTRRSSRRASGFGRF